ncbi:MAG: hypothetical protein JO107_05645, partial [Hyphomicrobiales bacterium]|nr:hypothetical protein [Hyphomicrobiales bacterium]
MAQLKTPAVYIVEEPGFANTVVEVETAVPAFIGYTEFAIQGSRNLKNVPLRLSSMSEFETYFGGPPATKFDLATADFAKGSFTFSEVGVQTEDKAADVGYQRHSRFYLYYSLQLFFDNGGSSCFIVSVGDYSSTIAAADLKRGLDALVAEPV